MKPDQTDLIENEVISAPLVENLFTLVILANDQGYLYNKVV